MVLGYNDDGTAVYDNRKESAHGKEKEEEEEGEGAGCCGDCCCGGYG